MALILIGLLVSAVVWWVAVQGIVWSWGRRINVAADSGILTDKRLATPTVAEVMLRRSSGWTFGFLILFVLLALADFPFWQRLGIAGALAVVYGSIWLSQSDRGSAAEVSPALQRSGSDVWYWLLAVGEWLGYLGVLCFASEAVIAIL
jgi:hypothetical protein